MSTNKTSAALEVFAKIARKEKKNPQSRRRFLAVLDRSKRMELALKVVPILILNGEFEKALEVIDSAVSYDPLSE